MTSIGSNDLSNIMIARRLMEIERNAEARRKGKLVDEKSALDYFKEDQALISDSAVAANENKPHLPVAGNQNVNTADARNAVQDLQNANRQDGQPVLAGAAHEAFNIEASQSIEIKLELRYRSNTAVEGLVVHDKNYAESDRYLFKFEDGVTFTILDKWANKSTTVWGDPHVDVDDVEGNVNGEFSDLKKSNDVTTFMLSDGTRVTFKAKDNGVIEKLDIFKGSQHVTGTGQGSADFSAENNLFSVKVLNDGVNSAASLQAGDIVYSGGDGNDWFDSNNKLIWGKTTGPVIQQRPSATLEFSYKQIISQSISVQTISKAA
ncbi:MAG: DUF1521 domain-containing protein [Chloroflexota bacterium]